MTRFEDIVGGDDLSPDEEARLRRVHDLLVQAGPPPDLPPELERPPTAADAEVVQFPLFPRRRWAAALVVAATLVAVAFGGGYLAGHSKTTGFHTLRAVPLHGATGLAVLRLAPKDSAGNWPMELEVTNLPQQRTEYYELWLTRNGKPVAPCGYFRVHGRTTTVRFSVPYNFKKFDGWVITAQGTRENGPGRVVLTT